MCVYMYAQTQGHLLFKYFSYLNYESKLYNVTTQQV